MLSRRKRALFEAILGSGRGIIATLKSSDGDETKVASVTKSATLVKLGKCGEEAFVKTIHNFLQMPSSEGAIFFANYFAFSSFCSIFAG